MLISLAMTEGIGFRRGVKRNRMKLKFIDIWQAHFHVKAWKPVFVELTGDAEEGIRGELQKSMYGTRDAAQNWEREYYEYLEGIGFS
jgi:hypothetical protein